MPYMASGNNIISIIIIYIELTVASFSSHVLNSHFDYHTEIPKVCLYHWNLSFKCLPVNITISAEWFYKL